ncbi:glycosyl hydrolase [Capsulimonas corticalis]|uniref:Glycosyl hydrolase n=1 Tax=Capsulimonas corticalis TaxID=2219043 RepID=A0A402D6R0_9BACT|nr:beta-glucosidase [Capsulimonas corticalis]BDI29339.1 glycosyl hydrolase [Capsulimonas corticalis]
MQTNRRQAKRQATSQRKLSCAFALGLAICSTAGLVRADAQAVYQDPKAPLEARVNDLFNRLTPEERRSLSTGTDFSTPAIPRLGVPIMDMADASQGVRGGGVGRLDGPATYFGSGVLFASSWDRELARKVGQAIGEELQNKRTGGQVILGPSVNIHRSPLGGRNAEYYSEDPFLSAETAVGYIQGVQSTGAAACVKHFACNNEEVDRGFVNVIVDERTLREIYLPAFEAAVKRGHVWTLMTSYNKVNGRHSSSNWYLDTCILRRDWGFDGMAMSDWGGVHEVAGTINAGNDLEMPGPGLLNAENIADALDSGDLTQTTLDESVHRILRTIIRTGVLDPKAAPDHSVVGSPEHLKIAHDAAAEGIILLKNQGGVLPLERGKIKTIAVFGSRAKSWQLGGGGSPDLKPTRAIFPLEGVTQAAGPGVNVTFAEGETPDAAQARAKKADVALLFVGGEHEAEGSDRHSMDLESKDLDLIRALSAANKNTVVIVSSGAPCKMSDWIDPVPGVIQAPFAGQEGGTAIGEILFGDISPSGKLTDTIGARREDYPDYGNFPGTNGAVHYSEGIYVGYRYFDKKNLQPTFPFGYGLSYTTFKYSNLHVAKNAWAPHGDLAVTVDITNTGAREGAEIAELYVHTDAPKIDRAVRELKGFDRLTLKPGETKTARFTLDARSFAYCDVPDKQWKSDKGSYTIEVGPNSRDLAQKTTVNLTSTWTERIPSIGAPLPPGPKPTLSTGKKVTVSSIQGGAEFHPEYATDGDLSTRWSSVWGVDPQWLAVDLGAPTQINRIELLWEKARALAYEIQISDDGQNWKSVFTTENGKGSRDVIKLEPVTTRWVRMYGVKRATTFGYSLYELNVYGPGK